MEGVVLCNMYFLCCVVCRPFSSRLPPAISSEHNDRPFKCLLMLAEAVRRPPPPPFEESCKKSTILHSTLLQFCRLSQAYNKVDPYLASGMPVSPDVFLASIFHMKSSVFSRLSFGFCMSDLFCSSRSSEVAHFATRAGCW